ncbi:MAG: hypothetical protein K0M70_13715 [Arenimonas sp.]|uniref:DUF6491 family protein n=1 Tax=Arenimonas sp. TaxID=1872635 RepID=UPI0025C020FB|nr:DUF6491 family protein [Arenimonas sp.]MBW8368902.1 hypothetical protein [Arenimonas sp.]
MRLSPVPVLALLLAATASAGDPATPRVPLKPADCLDPSTLRNWHYVDSTELLVDGGRRKYRITLAESCTDLGSAATIGFRGDSLSGRVCGHFGDRVVTPRMACRIERIELVPADAYREATSGAKGRVSAEAGRG